MVLRGGLCSGDEIPVRCNKERFVRQNQNIITGKTVALSNLQTNLKRPGGSNYKISLQQPNAAEGRGRLSISAKKIIREARFQARKNIVAGT